jgi:LPPG:FO 2-phospho-L-lactate transferase
MRIVGLGGGVGASRLWRALVERVDPGGLTLVVNTGDDLWIHGLRVCPDLDTTAYALSGRQDIDRGWGLRGETFRAMETLRGLNRLTPDQAPWFNLGDADLATHLFRTGGLREGRPLSRITAELAAALGVGPRLLPMTDDEVETHVLTVGGSLLHYQEFFVRRAAGEELRQVVHRGAEHARPAPGVLEAIGSADLVLLGPSNPLASIGPILAVPGVLQALAATAAPVVAVTPVVSAVPITDPGEARRAASRAVLLRAAGLSHTASAAASLLRGVADAFVLDRADAIELDAITEMGLQVALADTLLSAQGHARGPDGVAEVVDTILDLGARIGPRQDRRTPGSAS